MAQRFGYSVHTLRALMRDTQKEAWPPFFLPLKHGPKAPRPATIQLKDRIVDLRKRNYSIAEVRETLLRQGEEISNKIISLLLEKEGFTKLFRRTRAERRESLQAGREPAEEAEVEAFGVHPGVLTDYGGFFLYVPLLTQFGLGRLFPESGFYGSPEIY